LKELVEGIKTAAIVRSQVKHHSRDPAAAQALDGAGKSGNPLDVEGLAGWRSELV
jgi:hypothetical protein